MSCTVTTLIFVLEEQMQICQKYKNAQLLDKVTFYLERKNKRKVYMIVYICDYAMRLDTVYGIQLWTWHFGLGLLTNISFQQEFCINHKEIGDRFHCLL